VLASDMDQAAPGLKKGFYASITLEQLRKARSSPHKPFPPKNGYLEFDVRRYRPPTAHDICSAVHQAADAMLHPPIKNLGIKGLRHSAAEILKWPEKFDDRTLRMTLFSLYVFIEIGGTGGGCFRPMYSRFLQEAAGIAHCPAMEQAFRMLAESGVAFSRLGSLFKDAETSGENANRVIEASRLFKMIGDIEERVFELLSSQVPKR